MSADFAILSPKTPHDLGALEAECRAMLEDWLASHEGGMPPFADFGLGGSIPSSDDAAEMVFDPQGGLVGPDSPVLAEVRARLANVRSVITLERPDDVQVNPLLVSVLRYLLRGAGQGLVMFVNSLKTTERALQELGDLAEVPGFESAPMRAPDQAAGAVPTMPDASSPGRPKPRAIDVPSLIIDGLVADGLIALDPDRRRESLIKALDKALVAEHEISPVKALLELLFEHDAVAEVFGSDAELEASMRRALQPPRG